MADGSTLTASPSFLDLYMRFVSGESELHGMLEARMRADVDAALRAFNALDTHHPAVALENFLLVQHNRAHISFVGHYNHRIQAAYDYILRSVPWWVPTRIRRAA